MPIDRLLMFERINDVPNYVTKLLLELQDWSINKIAMNIASAGRITGTSEFILTSAQEQDIFQRDFKREIQRILNLSNNEINRLFREAAESNYIYDKRAFEAKGIPFTPFTNNYIVQRMVDNIILQTQGEMRNITRSMGFAVHTPSGVKFRPLTQFYQEAMDSATTKIYSGVQTFDGAIKEAVNKMANSGLRMVHYESGRSDRIDVAARRAIMGAMRDLTNMQSDYNAEEMDVSTFEMSWHGGHRPSHLWGGRRFDVNGIYYPTEQELYKKYTAPNGEIGTLDDFNCYHFKYSVFPDSPTTYTDEQLEQMEVNELVEKEFEGKKYKAYDARQQQRAMERAMRKTDSLIAGYKGVPEMEAELQQAQIKRRMQVKQYREFSKAMGIPTEMERVNTGFVA